MNNIFFEMEELKKKHDAIYEKIKNKKIAYIDIPIHYNTGDLLIYFGTEQFFLRHNLNVEYRALQHAVNNSKLAKCDIILVHGGGNFGDIYVDEHRCRENILLKHKDKEIIFLPQSIHFDNENELNKTIKIFKNFKNVTIYTRDNESFIIAKKICNNVAMMPDMAHSLHPLIEKSEITDITNRKKKILNLIRRDNEAIPIKRDINKLSFDWSDICNPSDMLTLRFVRLINKLKILEEKKIKIWNSQVNFNIKKAFQIINSHDLIYTDRLHGFILSYLLGKEIILFDNSYGKINRYVECWINNSELIKNKNEKAK